MSRRTGVNINRQLRGSSIEGDLQHTRTRGEMPILQRAVVMEVITDPAALTRERIDAIQEHVSNPHLATVMPTNSIIAKFVSNSRGTTIEPLIILFPFFSSHVQLPVSPGEIVQVIFEDPAGSGYEIGYWLTRLPGQRTIEDANYTHADRQFDPSLNPANWNSGQSGNASFPLPNFQNGANSDSTQTIRQSSPQERPYETIVNASETYRVITPEPVPRWRKRPQELIMQGANNTLICLGEDRQGGPRGAIEGTTRDAKGFAGTIDIVTGRGRFPPVSNMERPVGNSPWTIENTRGHRETNKAPYKYGLGGGALGDNPTEGDPDMQNDAARLYVTMQSEVDRNFNITERSYPDYSLHPTQPNEGTPGTANKSYVVGKADHIRLIARKDLEKGISGTILILREGEGDLAYIYINEEGKLQIEANKIYLGQGTNEKDGAPSEPYIKWSKYNDMVDHLQGQINTLKEHLVNLETTLESAFNTSAAVPYAQIASLVAAAGIINSYKTSMSTHIQGKSAESPQISLDAKSDKIYGE